jgi:hypothetical protein
MKGKRVRMKDQTIEGKGKDEYQKSCGFENELRGTPFL